MNDRIFKMGKLVLWGVGLWVFFAVITPRLVALSPAWHHYDRVQEENGLDSGALYYTNVPVVQSAEEAMKHAVKAGMAERRELDIAQRRNAEL